jgi:hypothetical protein
MSRLGESCKVMHFKPRKMQFIAVPRRRHFLIRRWKKIRNSILSLIPDFCAVRRSKSVLQIPAGYPDGFIRSPCISRNNYIGKGKKYGILVEDKHQT